MCAGPHVEVLWGDKNDLDVPGRKLGSMLSKWVMSPTYKYLINGIYWGYNVYNLFTNVLLTYWGIQVGGGYNKRQLVLWGDETMQIYGNFEGPLAMQRLGL